MNLVPQRRLRRTWTSLLSASALIALSQAAIAKKVICVDGCNSAFVNNHEGYERANMAAGDVIQVGGNLQDCLAMLANGDTLVIIAHGFGMGQGFIWGGAQYTGFGGGAGQHPVPAGFGALMMINVKFCSCWSAKDPDGAGANTPLTEKIRDAMGGAGNGHTVGGFTDLATSTVCYRVTGPNPDLAIANLKANNAWMNNPPTNRPGAATTQQTAAQAQLNTRFPPAGTYTVVITAYKQPVNKVVAPVGGGVGGCECPNNSPFCAFGEQDGQQYIVRGTGGLVPASGSGDGAWPNTLPTFPFSSTVILPASATSIDFVSLESFNHTFAGDLQIVLRDPSGTSHNLVHRPGFTGTGFGFACNPGGTYSIVGSEAPLIWPTACTTTLPPGGYNQLFGVWPNGVNNIFNTPLDQIPVIPGGQYSLVIYDWEAGDIGNFPSWHLGGHIVAPGPVSYCTSGTTTNGCVASMSASNNPSVSMSPPCVVVANNVEGQKSGILFYGLAPLNTPWAPGSNSFLCVKSPSQRTGTQNSGGTNGLCDGAFSLQWDAYQNAHPGALGQPWSIGDKAYVQAWFRDPPAVKTTNLSDALELTYLP